MLNLSATGTPFLFAGGYALQWRPACRKDKNRYGNETNQRRCSYHYCFLLSAPHTQGGEERRGEQQDDAIQEGVVDADLDAYVQGPVVLVPFVYSSACKQKGGAPSKVSACAEQDKTMLICLQLSAAAA
jgi:hypothetical protein